MARTTNFASLNIFSSTDEALGQLCVFATFESTTDSLISLLVQDIFAPGAIIVDLATSAAYINIGSTATPVFSLIDTSTGGLPPLADGSVWVGDALNAAVPVLISGDITIDNAGVATVIGATGAFEAGGAITNAGGTLAVGFISTALPQILTGAGAVNISTFQTRLTTSGTGDALTLANSTRTGQLKKISYVAEGAGSDTAILTPTAGNSFTTATFNTVGDYLVLMWTGASWLPVDYVGVVLA